MTSDDQQTSVQTLRIKSELLYRLKIHAAKTRKSQQEVMHTALVEYLDRHEANAVQTTSTKGKTK